MKCKKNFHHLLYIVLLLIFCGITNTAFAFTSQSFDTSTGFYNIICRANGSIHSEYFDISLSTSTYPQTYQNLNGTCSNWNNLLTYPNGFNAFLTAHTGTGANQHTAPYIFYLKVYSGSNSTGTYLDNYQIYWNGTNTYTPTTSFTSISISTSTQTVNIQGYWYATTTSGITERLFVYQNGLITGYTEQLGDTFNDRIATTTGAFNFSYSYRVLLKPTATTTAPITSTSTITAYIYQYNNNYGKDPFSGLYDPRYKTLLVATSTTIVGYTGYNIDTIVALNNYPEYECSITSLTGCFKNALVWVFYPTPDLINKYYLFIDNFQSKAPFGYATILIKSITGINNTSTPKFSISIPKTIKNIFFTPVDIAIGSALWLFFIFNFYKRIKHITI